MENHSFEYTYSAQQQQEVEAIRQKYLPKEEDKMEQLRRLHAVPMQKAQAAALAVGIIGALILGSTVLIFGISGNVTKLFCKKGGDHHD